MGAGHGGLGGWGGYVAFNGKCPLLRMKDPLGNT